MKFLVCGILRHSTLKYGIIKHPKGVFMRIKLTMSLILCCTTIGAAKLQYQDVFKHLMQFEPFLHLNAPAPIFKFKDKEAVQQFLQAISKKTQLEYALLKGIVAQESYYCKYKHNKSTNDYGCFQVNAATAKGLGIKTANLLRNDVVSILAGIKVLQQFKRQYEKMEPKTWACRYNIGNRRLPAACITYLNKIYAAAK